MPVKKKAHKKSKGGRKLRADMRAAVDQIPALLAAESEIRGNTRQDDDIVKYEESVKPTAGIPKYDENIHNGKMIWLWGAVSVFTILVAVMWFLNTRLTIKKYTSSSFNPLTNSQTEIELIKKTLKSSDLQNALSKVRVSNADLEISEALKKEIPEILSNFMSSTHISAIATSTSSTTELTVTTSTTNTSSSTEKIDKTTNFPISADTSSTTPSL
ncbi:MAG TPA: hypothetical protein PLV72_00420 [Candidatus Magasanikbacteria bacterium]|nr:hypothetical protein [Candidatus Magasanikbacteria bacterium]